MKHILLIEDDEQLRYALSRFLKAEGFDVTELPGAHEALALIDSGAPVDILVTDLVLGDHKAHGISLAQMARMRRNNLPAIFITAYAEHADYAKAHGPVMQKPIDPGLLALKIRHELKMSAD